MEQCDYTFILQTLLSIQWHLSLLFHIGHIYVNMIGS